MSRSPERHKRRRVMTETDCLLAWCSSVGGYVNATGPGVANKVGRLCGIALGRHTQESVLARRYLRLLSNHKASSPPCSSFFGSLWMKYNVPPPPSFQPGLPDEKWAWIACRLSRELPIVLPGDEEKILFHQDEAIDRAWADKTTYCMNVDEVEVEEEEEPTLHSDTPVLESKLISKVAAWFDIPEEMVREARERILIALAPLSANPDDSASMM